MTLLPKHHTKLALRYWRWLLWCGVKPTDRNKWICGNRVSLKLGIVPSGLALSWGISDRECGMISFMIRSGWRKDEFAHYTLRALEAAITSDFDK